VITILPARLEDARELAALINGVIAQGGTTAHEVPFTAESFAKYFLGGPDFISCFKAVDESGTALGFQTMGHDSHVPADWGDIGTFAKVGGVQKGVGSALFAATSRFARENNIPVINATIRADNTGGLAYYSKMGFVDYAVARGVPLKDGTPVDRISKKFVVTASA